MKALLNMIIDLFAWVYNLIKRVVMLVLEKFMEVNIFEKGIVILTIMAFAAVVTPMASYIIFDSYFSINNPIAHYMIGIVLVMLVTVYFHGLIPMTIRVLINVVYIIGVLYLQAAHEISKAPYELSAGYYINIITPLLYIILAIASGIIYRES